MSLPPPITPRLHRLSVWQLVLGVIGLMMTLLSILAVFALGILSRTNSSFSSFDFSQLEKTIWVQLVVALLTLPSIILSIRRLAGKSSQPSIVNNKSLYISSALIVVWLGLLWLGTRSEAWGFPSFVNSLINIVLVFLPILLWLTIGRYKLVSGSKQRAWGILNFSLFVTTQLILIIETIFVVTLAIIGVSSLIQQAEFLPYIQLFQSQGQLDQAAINSLMAELSPIFNQTSFYVLLALIFCVFVPLIEELFKPLAVWLFAKRGITPSEGWAAGLLCVAAFGLIESLSMMSIATSDIWLTTAVGRVGTGLLHIFTTGLSGFVLAKTWQDHKYWRLSLVYLAVIILHGSWNFFALLMGVNQLGLPITSSLLSLLMDISPWVLGGLAVLMALMILLINHHLRKQSVPPVLPVFQAEPEEQTAQPNLN